MLSAARTCIDLCVPCTIAFLISASPCLQSNIVVILIVGLAVKHRQPARRCFTAKDHQENLMTLTTCQKAQPMSLVPGSTLPTYRVASLGALPTPRNWRRQHRPDATASTTSSINSTKFHSQSTSKTQSNPNLPRNWKRIWMNYSKLESRKAVWPVEVFIAGLAWPTGLTGGSNWSDRSTEESEWN